MTARRIYLDANAGTLPRAGVAEAMAAALAVGNPSSVHAEGRAARRRMEDAREAIAAALDAPVDALVFTSGGTEANALALGRCGRDAVIVSAVEHRSVLDAVPGAAVAPCDGDGVVRLDVLDRALAAAGRTAVVSVMAANNETGVIQPIDDVVRIARAHDALVHVDAAQAFGRVPLSFRRSGADLMTVSAHKCGGPAGVGALVVGPRAALAPRGGGGQERGRRPGTEAAAAIVGFGVAAGTVTEGIADGARHAAMRDRLEAALPEAKVMGAAVPRLPNTTCLVMPGVTSAIQVMAFDLAGFAVSAGAACSSGKVAASHVLAAMGVDRDDAGCAVRVSLGWTTTDADIDAFIDAWRDLRSRLGVRVAA
jgi:cysteine desulfurase